MSSFPDHPHDTEDLAGGAADWQDRLPAPLSWAGAALLAGAVVVFLHQGTFSHPLLSEEAADLAAVGEVRDVILERWVEEPDAQTLRDGALEGMVGGTLDPFSDYVSPSELAAFNEHTTGKFGGLGIYITVEDGYVKVIAPIEDTPAWKAGMLPGDTIIRIDGEPAPEFKTASEAVDFLKGAPGTSIALTVVHAESNDVETFELERAVIQIRTVKGARILDDGVGYMRLTSFNAGTVEEFRQALGALQESGLQALILDLRGNPGGYLHAAAEVADAFLDQGRTIVSTRHRGGQVEQKIDAREPARAAAPVAVLVDGGSASASEILAGALQDNGVATIVGTRSYGKGSVQSLIDIMGGRAQLKLTTQYFFTPDGRRIHKGDRSDDDPSWGIVPDIRIPVELRVRRELALAESEWEMETLKRKASGEGAAVEDRLHVDDPQVKAAFQHLRRVLAGEEEIGHEREAADEMASIGTVDSGSRAAAPGGAEDAPADEGAPRDD